MEEVEGAQLVVLVAPAVVLVALAVVMVALAEVPVVPVVLEVADCYDTARGLQLCFPFFFHVSPFPPHVACRPRA